MLVAKSTLTHICQLDRALRTCVHEPIAALGVELCSCNDLSQFLHVGRLDIDNIKALVLNVEVPEVDSEVIAADECLTIAVD